jgi:hypothetical protein
VSSKGKSAVPAMRVLWRKELYLAPSTACRPFQCIAKQFSVGQAKGLLLFDLGPQGNMIDVTSNLFPIVESFLPIKPAV